MQEIQLYMIFNKIDASNSSCSAYFASVGLSRMFFTKVSSSLSAFPPSLLVRYLHSVSKSVRKIKCYSLSARNHEERPTNCDDEGIE